MRFEYIGYDKSWEETLKMLEDGEIDLVTSAKKTPEREEKFAFSKPIGSSYTIITVRNDNDRIISGNYKTYDGMTIGLLKGNSQNNNLEEFSQDKGFAYIPVYYDSVDELKDALKRGEIDAITTSSLRGVEGERVIEKFDANLFYAIVRKEDTSLLEEINYGIEQMDMTEGDWKNHLSYRYYDMEGSNTLQFTDREKELIQFYASDEHRLKVACNVDRDPYSYVEDGQMKGVIPDIFSYLMEMAGISFEYSIPESRAQYEEWRNSGDIDIFIDYDSENSHEAAERGGVVTADYLEMHIARLFRLDQTNTVRKIALANNQKLDENSLLPKDTEIEYYEDRESAMEAVVEGRADITYVYSFMAQKFINMHRGGNLSYSVLEEPSYAYCCYLPHGVNHELAGILTKCIYHMPSDEIQKIISENTRYQVENMTLAEYIILHPYSILAIIGAFVAATLIIVLFMKVQTKQKLLIQEKVILTEIPSDRPGYAMYQTVIEDTGIGISEEFLPHLFEEFTRERSSTESKLNGMGLGMPIVKKLVDLMQGTIEVESKIGKGTKITVTLPHRIVEKRETETFTEKTQGYDPSIFQGKRILLAEDNELNAEIAITILTEAGFEVEHAADGIICVDMVEKADPGYYDLILMDIQMPNMDGYKATQTIRNFADKKKAGIIIAAMTANAFEEDKQAAFKAGMNCHIAKPIVVEELMAALADMLKE